MSRDGQSESAVPERTHVVDPAGDAMSGNCFTINLRPVVALIGIFILVTAAVGSGVINHYVGGGPISRTAAVIALGAVVMAMIYALGPLSGLHINPAVTLAFTGRRGITRHGCCRPSPSGSPPQCAVRSSL